MFVRSFAVLRAYFAARSMSILDILRRMKVGLGGGGGSDSSDKMGPVAATPGMLGDSAGGDKGGGGPCGGAGGVGGGGDGTGASGGSGGGAGGLGSRKICSPALAAAAALHPPTKVHPGWLYRTPLETALFWCPEVIQ